MGSWSREKTETPGHPLGERVAQLSWSLFRMRWCSQDGPGTGTWEAYTHVAPTVRGATCKPWFPGSRRSTAYLLQSRVLSPNPFLLDLSSALTVVWPLRSGWARGNAFLENWAQTLRGKKSSSRGPLRRVQSFYTQSLYLGPCWGPVTAADEARRLRGLQRAAQTECSDGDLGLFPVLRTLPGHPCLEQQPALEQFPVAISELVGGSGF